MCIRDSVGVALFQREVRLLLEELACIGDPLGKTLPLKVEHRKRDAQVLLEDRVIQLRPCAGKTVDIGLQKEVLFLIQRFHIVGEDLFRHGVVKRRGLVVVAREDLRGPQGGLRLLRLRKEQRQLGTLGIECPRRGCEQPGEQNP